MGVFDNIPKKPNKAWVERVLTEHKVPIGVVNRWLSEVGKEATNFPHAVALITSDRGVYAQLPALVQAFEEQRRGSGSVAEDSVGGTGGSGDNPSGPGGPAGEVQDVGPSSGVASEPGSKETPSPPTGSDAGVGDVISVAEHERMLTEAHELARERAEAAKEEAVQSLAEEFECDSVEALRAKITKLKEMGRHHSLVLAQLKEYGEQVKGIVALGHIAAPLPAPFPGESEALAARFKDRVSARIRLEPHKDLNFGCSPIIRQTFEEAITVIQGRTGIKRQGLKKYLGALAIILLYTAMVNVPDGDWDSVSQVREDPTDEALLLDDLAKLLMERIVAKPKADQAAETPAEQEVAATGES